MLRRRLTQLLHPVLTRRQARLELAGRCPLRTPLLILDLFTRPQQLLAEPPPRRLERIDLHAALGERRLELARPPQCAIELAQPRFAVRDRPLEVTQLGVAHDGRALELPHPLLMRHRNLLELPRASLGAPPRLRLFSGAHQGRSNPL